MNKLKIVDVNTASDEIFDSLMEGQLDYDKFEVIRVGREPEEKTQCAAIGLDFWHFCEIIPLDRDGRFRVPA